jgi:hypothetical protein
MEGAMTTNIDRELAETELEQVVGGDTVSLQHETTHATIDGSTTINATKDPHKVLRAVDIF